MEQFSCGKEGLYGIEVVNESIIRVVYTKRPEIWNNSLMVDVEKNNKVFYKKEEDDCVFSICTNKIRLEVDKNNGICTWYERNSGKKYLQEGKKELYESELMRYQVKGEKPIIKRVKTVDGERNFIQNLETVADGKAYQGKIHFQWEDEEGIYGLGQGEEGIYNYRGHMQYLYQHNMRIPMPFFVSSHKYGIFVDCCSLMTFHDDGNGSYFYLDSVDQMDYYFIAGDQMDDIIRGLRLLTGRAQMLPKWAFGYIQSKEAYLSGEELVETVSEYRRRNVPLDCIVQDWWTWDKGNWGEKIVDKERYPNLKETIKTIHEMQVHTMVSIWPNMNQGGKNFEEMFAAGHMLMDLATYNAFEEDARTIYFKQAKEELFDSGFDSWWCDSTEPFSGPDWGGERRREPWERFTLVGEEHKKYLGAKRANAFAMMHAKGMYENQRKETAEKRVVNLTRSGYPSIQKYGAILWSGDTCATWKNLKIQLIEGLNMALSGIPYWTLDIGAFFTVKEKWQNRGCHCNQDATMKWFWQGDYEDGVRDLAYRELYTRWLQLGTFLPMFRSHGTDTPREIWNFGEKGEMFYNTIEKFINLRYTLMPYIYSLAGSVYLTGDTIQRSLLFDYLEDETAREIQDQFLFGPFILVCPVTEPMYYAPGSKEIKRKKEKKCYLPKGNAWYDYWTNEKHHGGQFVTVEAPLEKIPLFIKEGAIIPTSKGIQYATQEQSEPMEIMVYSGADGTFLFYEDEEDNYNFEKGIYATTQLQWKENTQELHIEKQQEGYPSILNQGNYKVTIVK